MNGYKVWWTIAGVGLLSAWLVQLVRIVRFVCSRPRLVEIETPVPSVDAPCVCVIVPACNEAAAIQQCLQSLLAQDYPSLHIIALNDRSTDDTGAIMDRLQRKDKRLTVIHIETLPGGWLGKNHANHVGATRVLEAGAEYLLFTDGDILFAPDAVRRAVAYAKSHAIDLLAVFPHLLPGGFWENAMCQFFGLCYLLKCKVWSIADPRRLDAFCGVGAFNLVTRRAYEIAGGHQRLRLEVVDDYKLGKLVKTSAGRCELLDSGGAVRVRWQVGLWGVVRGLEKNSLAGCDYRLAGMAIALVSLLGVFVLPWAIVCLLEGQVRWVWLGSAIVPSCLIGWLARRGGVSVWAGLVSPLCAIFMFWAMFRATVLTFWRGGVRWRGTFYRLDELRRGCV